MNTKISIHVNSNHSREFVYESINNAFAQFEYVVKNFSRFDPKSELSVLNSSSNKWTKVSDELFDLISFALDVSDKTNGIFDPTVIDILEKYGYDKDYNFSKLDDPEIKKRIDDLIRTRPNYKAVELNAKRKKVKLVDNQGIDLGAIGKGYAIDLAYDVLEKKFKNFFINAGGDIRVKGVNTIDKPWKIKLEYRDKKGTAETLGFAELTSGSICSSGAYARKVKDFHHLIDTKSGKPSDETAGTFVYAPSALLADTYSTVAFLMGVNAIRLIEKEKGIESAVILNSGRKVFTSGFKFEQI